MPDLLRQRIFGLALGYEDLIDHDALRDDPAVAAVLDKCPRGVLGTPREILDERFAKGEIERKVYEARRKALTES